MNLARMHKILFHVDVRYSNPSAIPFLTILVDRDLPGECYHHLVVIFNDFFRKKSVGILGRRETC